MRYSIEPRDRRYVKGYGLKGYAIKPASKRVIKKTAEATGNLIGKVTSAL